MDPLIAALVLLVIMLALLAGGFWIAMTLAACGWVGQAFFTSTTPGKNLFSAFWETTASWVLASDGIKAREAGVLLPKLSGTPAEAAAVHLMNSVTRANDDASVLVIDVEMNT